MARKKRPEAAKNAVAKREDEAQPILLEQPRQWEVFFRCQRHTILRSQIITALMSGTVLDVDRLPSSVLLDVVLLSTAAREFLQAEIVSDYELLLTRTREEWARPDWTCKVFSSIHARWANCILNGTRSFEEAEERYIPDLTAWYIQHDVPNYFSVEFQTPADVRKFKRAA